MRGLSRATVSVPLVISVVVGLLIIAFILFPVYTICSAGAPESSDLSNIRQLALGHGMYMSDHDGYGPPPDQWMDALKPYTKNELIFTNPGLDQDAGEYGYAYLRELGGVHLDDVINPAKVPVLFNSSDLRRNVAGGLDLLPDPPRWEGGNNIAFLDSHAKRHETAPTFTIELP